MFCCWHTCRYRAQARKSADHNRFNEPEIKLDAAHMGPDIILLSKQQRVTGTGGVLATAPLVQSKSYFEVKIQHAGIWSIGIATGEADLLAKWGGSDRESWCLCSDNATRHNGEIFRPVISACAPAAVVFDNNENDKVTVDAATGLIALEDLQEDVLLTTGNQCAPTQLKNSEQLSRSIMQPRFPDEGDVIGVAFDHIELNFYFNGKNLDVPFRNVKGATLFPVLYVADGAILDIILENFNYAPPAGFERIMIEQSLL